MAPTPALPTQSAAAVCRDGEGRFLIVKPGYKDGWNLPGGGVEIGEPPSEAARRELLEELNVEQEIGRLLVCAYVYPQDNQPEDKQPVDNQPGDDEPTDSQARGDAHIYWVFDGGVISDEQRAGIRLQESELKDYRFSAAGDIGPDEIPPAVRSVWERALASLADGGTRYDEVPR
ncbi:NUDIX domain-containing protein [Streptomyces sp. NPDC002817]|uniref:NUDIX hydrolase n=1 Tax=Streptomyces sp. NPDC088357 TaxID=3154655 RepID=UPI00342DF388